MKPDAFWAKLIGFLRDRASPGIQPVLTRDEQRLVDLAPPQIREDCAPWDPDLDRDVPQSIAAIDCVPYAVDEVFYFLLDPGVDPWPAFQRRMAKEGVPVGDAQGCGAGTPGDVQAGMQTFCYIENGKANLRWLRQGPRHLQRGHQRGPQGRARAADRHPEPAGLVEPEREDALMLGTTPPPHPSDGARQPTESGAYCPCDLTRPEGWRHAGWPSPVGPRRMTPAGPAPPPPPRRATPLRHPHVSPAAGSARGGRRPGRRRRAPRAAGR